MPPVKTTRFNRRFHNVEIHFFPIQKADTTDHIESVEPPKPEKKKTRKEKKRGASPDDDEEGEEGHPAEERNGQQKDNKKVKFKKK